MNETKSIRGAFPTMVTPYNENGSVDYGAVAALTEWYWQEGCRGIFASCQSSEIWFLSEEDRVALAKTVKETADGLACRDKSRPPMTVVASGHVSDSHGDQVRELNRIADTGVDAVILITNRMDIANTGDDAWLRDAEALENALPQAVPLGLYECPHPYKRLLTPAMLRHVADTGRYRFIKDTCCDADEIDRRMELLRGTDLLLYNANAQTLLRSLQAGAAGYCGIMSNFHPRLYNWLVENFDREPRKAALVADVCSMAAFTEAPIPYPVSAKYHLRELAGVPMSLYSRAKRADLFTAYHAMCVRQMDELAHAVAEQLYI